MPTNKEQNQSDITAIKSDFLPKEYTIEDIRNFEPQLADWIEQRIHQAEIDARNEVISKLRPYIDELEKIKTAEQRELQLVAFARAVERLPEIVAELERGNDVAD